MLAPVYRSLETRSTILGLAFPAEFSLVLVAWWGGMLGLGAFPGLFLALGTYALVRSVGYGRSEGFVQHWLQWQLRRLLYSSRLSAGSRVGSSRIRRFPFGTYSSSHLHLAPCRAMPALPERADGT
jgi:hypothetical protein